MTQVNDVIAAIAAAIEQRYPGERVYKELAPKGFDRPSFLAECMDMSAERITCGMVQMTAKAKVTCFDEADVRGYSQFALLSVRQMAVMAIFLRGYLRTADGTAISVTGPTAASAGYDFAEVTATLRWEENYSEFEQIELPPLIAEVALDLTPKFEEEYPNGNA